MAPIYAVSLICICRTHFSSLYEHQMALYAALMILDSDNTKKFPKDAYVMSWILVIRLIQADIYFLRISVACFVMLIRQRWASFLDSKAIRCRWNAGNE